MQKNRLASAVTFVFFIMMVSCGKKKKDEDQTAKPFIDIALLNSLSEAAPLDLTKKATDSDLQKAFRDIMNPNEADSFASMFSRLDAAMTDLNLKVALSSNPQNPNCFQKEPGSRSILTPDFQAFSMYLQCWIDQSDSFTIFGGTIKKAIYVYHRAADFVFILSVLYAAEKPSIVQGHAAQGFSESSSKPASVIYFNFEPGTFRASHASSRKSCGITFALQGDSLHVQGSASSAAGQDCASEEKKQLSLGDFTQAGALNSSLLPTVSYQRKAGTSASGDTVTAYPANAGNVDLTKQMNPNINGADLNFGPSTASELAGESLQ